MIQIFTFDGYLILFTNYLYKKRLNSFSISNILFSSSIFLIIKQTLIVLLKLIGIYVNLLVYEMKIFGINENNFFFLTKIHFNSIQTFFYNAYKYPVHPLVKFHQIFRIAKPVTNIYFFIDP